MIKIGINGNKSICSSRILNSGEIIFNGTCRIASGVIIEGKGRLILGNDVLINENCKIMCQYQIQIGSYTRIGFDNLFMDTDYHFIVNTSTGEIKKNFGNVFIGDNCWISSNCKIMKGSYLPNGAIIISNSLVNKDFSKVSNDCIFGGIPAKLLKQGYKRLVNINEEKRITSFFEQNSSLDIYNINIEYFNSINNE